MKKLYLSLSLLFIGLLSQAQITKGTILLGGDLGFYTNSDKTTYQNNFPSIAPSNEKSNTVNVQPSVGWP
jgi:hypothetical protein